MPTANQDANLAARLAAACSAGELTTPASRDLCALALRVCELELANAALRGQLAAVERRVRAARSERPCRP